VEKRKVDKIEFNPVKSNKTGKKLVGVDLESLKKRVESNPMIEVIKEKIKRNALSTEWRLFFDIDQIAEGDQARF
jgi:hypothetical protein